MSPEPTTVATALDEALAPDGALEPSDEGAMASARAARRPPAGAVGMLGGFGSPMAAALMSEMNQKQRDRLRIRGESIGRPADE